MDKRYTHLTDLMDEVYQAIGAEFADGYDILAIAQELYTTDCDGYLYADLERDDFWLIVAEHDLADDWTETVELPEGTDRDVATVVNACTYMVRHTKMLTCPDCTTVSAWFAKVCPKSAGIVYLYEDCGHMLSRADVMTTEWRNDNSALDRERAMLEAWYSATRLCEYRHLDPTDSQALCEALAHFERNPNDWFTLYYAARKHYDQTR